MNITVQCDFDGTPQFIIATRGNINTPEYLTLTGDWRVIPLLADGHQEPLPNDVCLPVWMSHRGYAK